MEPITHFLTGACISRAGLNRKSAWSTFAAVLAAEAADLDVLWSLAGPVEGLKHHRGITHTFLAAPLVAAACVGVVWLIDRGLQKWRNPNTDSSPLLRYGEKSSTPQVVRWGWLYLTALLAALSHLFLDWTNNYGLRPFFPFHPKWYAGSFVFIAEPLIWALLFSAMIFPWLFGLVAAEVGAKKEKKRGQAWAIFALAGMVLLWGERWTERGHARALVENTQVTADPIRRVDLEPYPLNPWRWHAILETTEYYQTAEVNSRTGNIETDASRDVLYKPQWTPSLEAAKHTQLGQVWLNWSSWPVLSDVGQKPIPGLEPPRLPPGHTWTTIEFCDLRWDYFSLGAAHSRSRTPLSGAVYIVDGHEEDGMMLNGREQH